MSRVKFLKQFFRDYKEIGSITPSSRILVRKMLKAIDFTKATVLVELGPGTGCFTEEILKQMRPDAALVAFETNKAFCDTLNEKMPDKRLHVINDSAEKIQEYLGKLGLGKADIVLSGLPLTNIPEPIKSNIVAESANCLKPDGLYTQYQYLTTARKILKKYFKVVKVRWTPANLPPAFYYICTN
jgi:phosphatidylethanolamine/phosphatidyl-N-methylethanolamine N-methyltransferase